MTKEKLNVLDKEMATLLGVLSMNDFAKVMERGRSTIYDWKNKGKLPANCFKRIGGTWYVKVDKMKAFMAA